MQKQAGTKELLIGSSEDFAVVRNSKKWEARGAILRLFKTRARGEILRGFPVSPFHETCPNSVYLRPLWARIILLIGGNMLVSNLDNLSQ